MEMAKTPASFKSRLIGETEVFRRVLEMIPRMAEVDAGVLILGETGTGKELVSGTTCWAVFHEVDARYYVIQADACESTA